MKIYKAFLYTVLLVLIQSLIGLLIGLIFRQIDPNSQVFYDHSLGLFRTFAQLTGYLIFFNYFWKPKINWIQKNDFKINNFKVILLIILIGTGYELIKSPFSDFNNLLKHLNKNNLINHSNYFNHFNIEWIYRSFGVLIIAPIFEEFFYRKYLINNLLLKNSKILALAVSSLCFSIIHFETPNNLIPAFLFGVGSGIIYLKTNKIGYSILLHFFCNSLWLLDVVFGDKFYNYLYKLEFNSTYWIIFFSGILLCYLGLKKITKAKTFKS